MTNDQIKKWFTARRYTLKFNQVEPVYRRRRIYAVASPNQTGAWLSFPDRGAVEMHIRERSHYEREIKAALVL